MGADLICYIAFGPKRICVNDRGITEVAQQVRQYLDACIAAAEQVLLGKNDVPDPHEGPVEARRSVTLRLAVEGRAPIPGFASLEELRSYPEYRSLVQGVLADCGHEVESDHVFAGTSDELTRAVEEFVADWNDGGSRDLTCRDDPAGRGYQMLKKAFGLTIAQSLGVS